MENKLEIEKTCPDCFGEKTHTVDYHNPADFHGHGQYESPCETCEGTGMVEIEEEEAKNRAGIRALWASAQKNMTPQTQERVRRRVREGWSLDKAIKNEGLICNRRSIDIAPAKEMFDAGDLGITKPEPKPKAENLTPEVAVHFGVDMGAPEGDKTVETVYEKKEGSFIPRPKSNQQ